MTMIQPLISWSTLSLVKFYQDQWEDVDDSGEKTTIWPEKRGGGINASHYSRYANNHSPVGDGKSRHCIRWLYHSLKEVSTAKRRKKQSIVYIWRDISCTFAEKGTDGLLQPALCDSMHAAVVVSAVEMRRVFLLIILPVTMSSNIVGIPHSALSTTVIISYNTGFGKERLFHYLKGIHCMAGCMLSTY